MSETPKYVEARIGRFIISGTPEELAQLLAKQIGDNLAQRIAAEVSLSVEKRIDKALRDQTSVLSNCGWSPRFGAWKPDEDNNEEPKF